jgi:hypothetical protein
MNEREKRKLGFIGTIIRCLISPRSSFRAILEKPSLMKATAVVLIIAILAAWASFNYRGKLPPGQAGQALIIMEAMITLIGVFGTWLISSALIHGFSRTLGGRGYFRSMLTLAGYASAPLLIQHAIRLVDSFMVSQEALLQLATSLRLNPIANAALDIFTIFRIWSIVLLVIAARENYKISTKRSIAATGLSFIVILFISALHLPIT